MPIPTADRVKKRRDVLRSQGLRPLQIWVPDTRIPGFDEECKRQSQIAATADAADTELMDFMDDALSDIDGWSE